MDAEKVFSRRLFGIILLFMGMLCLLVIALEYWGIAHISIRLTALSSAHPDIADFKAVANWIADTKGCFIRYGAPLIAAGFVLWSILLWLAIRRIPSKLRTAFPQPRICEPENRLDREQQDGRLFIHLLSMFQREGRLLDFFSENLDGYEDAQIGAAVRSIHENCNKVTLKYLSLRPVLDQEEGQTITLQKGFDTAAVKLVGNVAGEPPFTGVIRHKGWKTAKLELPTLSASQDASLIAPAEVEISSLVERKPI
ncbi:MAG: DUF2760 domain-containing protein [Pseudomonadota bacterium]